MKLLLCISLSLLAFCLPALSWRGEFDPDRDSLMQADEYFDLSSQSVDEQQGTPPPAGYDLNDDALEEGFEVFSDQQDEDAMEQIRALRSGCTISLRLPLCGRWFTCRSKYCSSTFRDCAAAHFRIYRALGSGSILTGDFVALHYSYGGSSWFSLKRNIGQKSTCPGSPNAAYGFKSFRSWFTCSTEVFQVYAKGKGIGATITNGDTIALYHPGVTTNGYVQFYSSAVRLSQCMVHRSKYVRPPSPAAFGQCHWDSVQIKIYD